MTRPATDPAAPGAARPDNEKAAAITFGVIAMLALGWAGAVVAALAVGTERAIGRPLPGRRRDEQEQQAHDAARADRIRLRAAESRDWLERDRAERAELRERRRKHNAAVAKGETPAEPKPTGPGAFRKTGRSVRRFLHRSRAVRPAAQSVFAKAQHALREFGEGFSDTLAEAKPHVAEGYRATYDARNRVAAKPTDDAAPPAAPTPDPPTPVEQVVPAAPESPAPAPAEPAAPQVTADDSVRPDVYSGPGNDNKTTQPPEGDKLQQGLRKDLEAAGTHLVPHDAGPLGIQPADPEHAPTTAAPAAKGEQTMALPTIGNIQSGATGGGEGLHNALEARFDACRGHVNAVSDATDSMMARAASLRAEAQALHDAAGQDATTQTTAAIDALNALAADIEANAGRINELAEGVRDHIDSGDDGLKPAHQADDGLRTAGATSDLISTNTGRE